MPEVPADLVTADRLGDARAVVSQYREGWRVGQFSEPNRFFDSGWYALHNNDWRCHASPFEHFVHVGLREGRDPSPFVDFGRLRATLPGRTNNDVYASLLRNGAGPSAGVYESVDVLRDVQRSFLDAIELVFLARPPDTKRPNLVFVQNGESPRVSRWTMDERRTFDVWSNHYNTSGLATSRTADLRTFQVGTKFSGMATIASADPALLNGYDYVLLVDDDIALSAEQIEAAFAECAALRADLAQPSLDAASECAWPDLFTGAVQPGALAINTVEIMMPIFSGSFLSSVLETFALSVSGFGLDLLWGDRLGEAGHAWRLGDVEAHHENPIDRAGGPYYAFLRDNDINPRAELWALVQEFGLRRSIRRWPTV